MPSIINPNIDPISHASVPLKRKTKKDSMGYFTSNLLNNTEVRLLEELVNKRSTKVYLVAQ